jgi:hypothetical protein
MERKSALSFAGRGLLTAMAFGPVGISMMRACWDPSSVLANEHGGDEIQERDLMK